MQKILILSYYLGSGPAFEEALGPLLTTSSGGEAGGGGHTDAVRLVADNTGGVVAPLPRLAGRLDPLPGP